MKAKEKASKSKKEVKNLPPIRNSGQQSGAVAPAPDDNVSAAMKEKDKVF